MLINNQHIRLMGLDCEARLVSTEGGCAICTISISCNLGWIGLMVSDGLIHCILKIILSFVG